MIYDSNTTRKYQNTKQIVPYTKLYPWPPISKHWGDILHTADSEENKTQVESVQLGKTWDFRDRVKWSGGVGVGVENCVEFNSLAL